MVRISDQKVLDLELVEVHCQTLDHKQFSNWRFLSYQVHLKQLLQL